MRAPRWLSLGFLLLILGCQAGFLQSTTVITPEPMGPDGTYIGLEPRRDNFPDVQLIRVAVDMSQGRIMRVRLLQHPAWRSPQEQEEMLRLVTLTQTTSGHVPRGTGSEADRLLEAIDDALGHVRTVPLAQP